MSSETSVPTADEKAKSYWRNILTDEALDQTLAKLPHAEFRVCDEGMECVTYIGDIELPPERYGATGRYPVTMQAALILQVVRDKHANPQYKAWSVLSDQKIAICATRCMAFLIADGKSLWLDSCGGEDRDIGRQIALRELIEPELRRLRDALLA